VVSKNMSFWVAKLVAIVVSAHSLYEQQQQQLHHPAKKQTAAKPFFFDTC